MTKPTHDRKDDAFLRRIVWILLTLAITSSGGWVYSIAYMQSDINHNNSKIEKLEKIQSEINRSMTSIDTGVSVLVALAEERNKQQKESIKKQEYIFGEQKRRKPMIAWIERQMGMTE